MGLDGATFNIILPMVKNHDLPIFEEIMENGAWGDIYIGLKSSKGMPPSVNISERSFVKIIY